MKLYRNGGGVERAWRLGGVCWEKVRGRGKGGREGKGQFGDEGEKRGGKMGRG